MAEKSYYRIGTEVDYKIPTEGTPTQRGRPRCGTIVKNINRTTVVIKNEFFNREEVVKRKYILREHAPSYNRKEKVEEAA